MTKLHRKSNTVDGKKALSMFKQVFGDLLEAEVEKARVSGTFEHSNESTGAFLASVLFSTAHEVKEQRAELELGYNPDLMLGTLMAVLKSKGLK